MAGITFITVTGYHVAKPSWVAIEHLIFFFVKIYLPLAVIPRTLVKLTIFYLKKNDKQYGPVRTVVIMKYF